MRLMAARRTKHEPLSADAVALIAARFRTLGDPLRIQLLQALQSAERNVTDLVSAVGSTQSNVSRHLRILQEAGLIGRRQEGNNVFYAIADPSVFALCDAVCNSISERLAQHATLGDELRRRGRRR
jgi:ArsR family transcriptional regulator